MRNNRLFKFVYLVISFVCISMLLSAMLMTTKLRDIQNIFLSDMHEGSVVTRDFYMSKAFDNELMGYIARISSNSAINIDSKSDKNTEDSRKYFQESLKEIKNADYFIINNKTKEINTNTKYETAKEFKSNAKERYFIKISCKDGIISYSKRVDGKEYINENAYNQLGGPITSYEYDIYISIHNILEYWDFIREAKQNFDDNMYYIEILGEIIIVAFVLGLINILLYKINKSVLFDKDSFWLRLSKFIPLELYILSLLFNSIFFFSVLNYEIGESCILTFLSIGYFLTVLYIFDRQINSFEDRLEFFSTSLTYKIFKFFKVSLSKLLHLNKEMPITNRIIGLAVICVIFDMFMMVISGSLFIAFISAAITTTVFTYYIIRKLYYLSHIMDGTQRIKNGDVHYKLDLVGDDKLTILADNINNIGEGLDNAIDSQLKSERMKSELITNVSHDLKTPLTSIINYVELIKKEENITPEYVKDYINVLDSKSKRLKILIEDLFEASKASTGNIELNMEKIDLNQLLRQSIGELEDRLLEAKLELKVNVPDDKIYIKADGRRLHRVLENLLNNICKYSLPSTRVYIDIIESDEKIKLTMKNISSYELNFDPVEIMERFKRADESRNTEGSGLGLAIARDLVTLQGGKFDLEIDGDLFKSIVEFNKIK